MAEHELSIAKALLEMHRRTVEPLLEMQRRLGEPLEAVGRLMEDYKKLYESLQPALGELAQFAERLRKEVKLTAKVMRKTEWWFCPSLSGNLPTISIAVESYTRGNRRSITQMMKKIYQSNECTYLKEVVEGWSDNPFFGPRMHIIRDALEAHINGKYNLSIPTLLPQAEGIAGDYCKARKIEITGKERSKGGVKIKKAIESKIGPDRLATETLLWTIENSAYESTDKIKDPFKKKLNRHGILHGQYKNYGYCSNSLRCFLLLDALSVLK